MHTIGDGTEVGNNLFHSFGEFSLPTGSEALFDNAANIENIFSRVTGGAVSNIDGLIETNGSANLFLLNPNGIIFGENTALDIGGVFSAIAGETIRFEDGEYSAVAPDNSVLSINLPLGVQLGEDPDGVKVEGNGSGLFINEFGEPDFSQKTDGLTNSNINLIAGEINIDGGNVTTPEGTLNLVAGSGGVELTEGVKPLSADTPRNIELTKGGSLSSSSEEGAGQIDIDAANLKIYDGAGIIAINEGEASPGAIAINATETVEIRGETPNGDFPSYIGVDAGFLASQRRRYKYK